MMIGMNNEKMDEEKTFEVIQEEGAVPQAQFAGPVPPNLVKRGLTEVSAMFDRTGKGYLDETERALRRMDSQDKGYLGIDKVCVIFESLQAEQERSSQLLEALRTESKKSLNLKKGVIALTVFTVLLALANIGTSFAVATLVKDMQVNQQGDLLTKDTHIRVGTTAKIVSFGINGVTPDQRRRLTQLGLACDTTTDTDSAGNTNKDCQLQGTVSEDIADSLHDELEAVDHVMLTCNGKRSQIYGTYKLPAGDPGYFNMTGYNYTIFPTNTTADDKYQAVQSVYNSTSDSYCDSYFELAIYCPQFEINGVAKPDCMVITAFSPTEACNIPPIICGPPPTNNNGAIV